ncbi:rod-binding protein [Mangrovibacter yixingensis]|uniref:rod-binding protein n=1 Tax=Mangrovibacter yixingensis TaxID=1529639 RepID=UPI001CFE12FD|nr:rod-binding protein [Mangrovibacter yixingensis]
MITSLSSTTSSPGSLAMGESRPQNLAEAASQFEAMFLRTLLSQMRSANTALNQDSLFNSKQQTMLRELYDDQLADHLAAQGSVGISRMILAQLGGQNKSAT